MNRFCISFLILVVCATGLSHATQPKLNVDIVYLSRAYKEPLPLSLVEPIITDKGLQGARLGLKDNKTTGRILKHNYELIEYKSEDSSDALLNMAREILSKGYRYIVADLKVDDLLAISALPGAEDAIILNIRARDDRLRGIDCQRNLFHVTPSYAMRADALAQYFAWKRWNKWFLVFGQRPYDLLYVAALKRAAKRFGSKIVEERQFTFDAGNRRTDTGHQQIQKQMPLLTQGTPDHHIVVVADLDEAFGEFLLWRTAVPKPVAGTQGLMPLAWHRSYEQYGGTQIHSRFEKLAHRIMIELDYLGWLAVRIIGEAVTRANTADPKELRAFLMSDKFTIAAFKGQGLNFRTWNRQMRQPILLSGPRTLVSMSPQEGFLHQSYLTDTLGYDKPETKCRLPN